MIKWIAGIVGYFIWGGFGAFIGYFIGSIIDGIIARRKIYSYKGGAFNPLNVQAKSISPLDFELHLLTIASLVVKADGVGSENEYNYVNQFFIAQFGKERANATIRRYNELVKNTQINLQQTCQYLNARTRVEVRIQLLHFLFGIAQADGQVSDSEIQLLKTIAGYFHISTSDYESIKAMFVKSSDESYKILGISKDAPMEEVKKAYRKMVKKYHPDRLQGMDEVFKKDAKEKFNKVQEAYEQISKERGWH